jgi:hypothetical protein
MATPSLTLNPAKVPLGNPVEMTYRFVVAADATFTQNYRVMVHFVDADDGLMYQDDHDPPVPTSQWKPGQTIEYKRLWFVPVYPYVGEASVEVGLYCRGCKLRVPLAGHDVGHRSYSVARFELLPQSAGVTVLYKDGWYETEGTDSSGEGSWHWTKKDAKLSVKNPKRDSVLYLKVVGGYNDRQQVTVSIAGGPTLDTFSVSVPDPAATLRKIPISAAQWGGDDTVELRLAIEKSFVPNQLSPSANDSRELGVRVFRAVVVPSGT